MWAKQNNLFTNKFPDTLVNSQEKTMIISDLNYLEVATEEVVGGFAFTATKTVNIGVVVTETININKTVNSTVNITGNLATAESGATALGNNSLAEAFAFTFTGNGTSAANAFSVSATKP